MSEGLRQAKSCELIYNPSVHSLTLMSTSPFRAGLIWELIKHSKRLPGRCSELSAASGG